MRHEDVFKTELISKTEQLQERITRVERFWEEHAVLSFNCILSKVPAGTCCVYSVVSFCAIKSLSEQDTCVSVNNQKSKVIMLYFNRSLFSIFIMTSFSIMQIILIYQDM